MERGGKGEGAYARWVPLPHPATLAIMLSGGPGGGAGWHGPGGPSFALSGTAARPPEWENKEPPSRGHWDEGSV